MELESINREKFNGNEKLTIYLPRKDILKLKLIKDVIYTEYDIIVPLSEFMRDAVKDFLVFPFNDESDLKQDIEFYLKNKGLI